MFSAESSLSSDHEIEPFEVQTRERDHPPAGLDDKDVGPTLTSPPSVCSIFHRHGQATCRRAANEAVYKQTYRYDASSSEGDGEEIGGQALKYSTAFA